MNMMDEGESFYATREGFAHLSDLEWSAVGQMSSTVVDIGITAMLKSLAETNSMPSSPGSFNMNLLPNGRK